MDKKIETNEDLLHATCRMQAYHIIYDAVDAIRKKAQDECDEALEEVAFQATELIRDLELEIDREIDQARCHGNVCC